MSRPMHKYIGITVLVLFIGIISAVMIDRYTNLMYWSHLLMIIHRPERSVQDTRNRLRNLLHAHFEIHMSGQIPTSPVIYVGHHHHEYALDSLMIFNLPGEIFIIKKDTVDTHTPSSYALLKFQKYANECLYLLPRIHAYQSLEQQCRTYFDQCASIFIFPEGSNRNVDGTLPIFHTGAARLSMATGVPIVPFMVEQSSPYTLCGMRESIFHKRSRVNAIIMDALYPTEYTTPEEMTAQMHHVMSKQIADWNAKSM